MIVAACPACHEQVTVPIDASPSSLVRCPLCHAELHLAAFLSQLPPPLIVVQHQGTPPGGELAQPDIASDSGGLPPDASERSDVPSSLGADEPVPAFDFTPGSAPASQPARAREPARRPPRPQKNMAWEIAKIVGGGLLAVPAAQAILWWFVPRDWQRDLLGIGPAVSRVVPWVVPLQFRDAGPEGEWDDVDSGGGEAGDVRLDRQDASPLTSRQVAPRVAGKPKDASPARDQPDPSVSKATASKVEPGKQESATGKRPADELASSPAADGSSTTPSAAARTGDTDVSQAIGGPTAIYQAEDLRVALEQARQASDDWDTSPDQSEEHLAVLTDAFYQAFARLGEILFSLSRDDPQGEVLLKDLSVLLESFVRQPKKLAMIGNRGQTWLDQATRPNSGVVLFGTVRAMNPFGNLFATDLDLAAIQKRAVTVISPGDPQRFYGVGDRVLILGMLVPPPADIVAAAPQGESPETFVWGSLPISLGK
jgi:hypothetical protein